MRVDAQLVAANRDRLLSLLHEVTQLDRILLASGAVQPGHVALVL